MYEVVLGCIGAYLGCSLLLFFFPSVLHRRKRPFFTARAIAHRGGAAENCENSMAAFKHAVRVGADMLEIDVQITKDNRVVVCHDNDLSRLTGHKILVSETCYHELPQVTTPQPCFHLPDTLVGGSRQSGENGDNKLQTQIPLLETLFETFPTTPINLDLKLADVNLRIQVESLIRQYNREHITPWGNFSDQVTSQLFKLNPNIPLIMSTKKVILHCAVFWFGILPFVPIKESYYEIPILAPMVKTWFPKWWQGILARICDFLIANPLLLYHYHRRGIVTYCWVLNDESLFPAALAKFDGVITDRITPLVETANQIRDTRANHRQHCCKSS